VPRDEQGYETPKWRTFGLIVGFAVLTAIGIVTVLHPELEDEPNEEVVGEVEPIGEPELGEPPQE
jgi:hypothetical protein